MLKKETKAEFDEALQDELTDILIKILDEEGYIDGVDKNQIRNEIIILFNGSKYSLETNNNILEHTGLMGKIDNDTLKKLDFSGKDIVAFENTLSNLNKITEHIDNISNIYDALHKDDNELDLRTAMSSALDEIGLIVDEIPYIGKFLSFEMELFKRLFEIESDLIESHGI